MQDNIRRTLFVTLGIALMVPCVCSCTDDDSPQQTARGRLHPITISSVYPSDGVQTRATVDGGFVADDAMGIFVVDRSDDGEAVTPAIGSGRASNIKFTLGEDGRWTSAKQLYWDIKGRAADFYGYYPFNNDLSSVTNYQFAVSQRQDAEAGSSAASGYISSDLLWTKAENVEPTTEAVVLQYHHLMAGVTVRLEKGSGFTSDEWSKYDKTVLLENMATSGIVDLSEGEASANTSDELKTIIPLLHNGEWRAVTYPQTVATGKTLVSVTIDGQSYALKRDADMTFISGKMHTFTITVDRRESSGQYTFTCSDEAITPWIDDSELHDGLVREYVVVEVSAPGMLAEDLALMGQDCQKVECLKVVGTVNRADMEFMATMRHLTDLNMQKSIIEDGVLAGLKGSFEDILPIRRFIFPEKSVKVIGEGFMQWSSMFGSLVIPEGIERIEPWAFANNSFKGTLSLPSTLKRIEHSAFTFTGFTGPLNLPEGLEYLDHVPGDYASFSECDFSGTLHFPPLLKTCCPLGFPKMTGDIIIPQGWTDSDFFGGGGYDGVLVLPEGMERVAGFGGTKIHGEVKIPSTCKVLGGLSGTFISGVVFPENLQRLEEGCFWGCSRLSGTIEIPKKIAYIPPHCFENCPMLTGVVIPANVMLIDELAFAECVNLNSIVCEGEEPPLVADNAFLGVPKDQFTVEVPKGCVEKYRNARGWSKFKRIAEYSGFVCRPSKVCALNTVHSEELVLNADGAWRLARKPSWCSVSRESGAGKTALTVNILPMAHGAGNRQDTLVFEMQQGSRTIETACLLSQYDYEYEADSYITLQKASKGNNGGIDIVFAGDGYDAASIADGSYLELVKYQSECFFAVEPYRSMREYFNVYVTFPLSQEKGVNTMYTYVNNRFGTLYGMNELTVEDMTSTALITESDEVVDYVVEKTPLRRENLWRSLVILVPNSTDYDGHTELMDNGAALVICPPSDKPYPRDTRGVVQHEAGGHGFGKLGDEEIVRNAFAPLRIKSEVDKMHGRGWYQNLSTTGKLSQVPWADFIFDTRYSDFVDVYEGGYGYTRGIYRAEANSCMNYGIPYYNTPSRLEIYRRIKECAGEEFRMDDFRQSDTFEWGATTITRSLVTDVKNLKSYADGNHQRPLLTDFRQRGNKVRQIINRLRKERINK